MNYYEPREIMDPETKKGTGKWRYTCMNDGRVWAIGYCAQDCPGHDTKDGAYEHYRQYILDKTEYPAHVVAKNPDGTLVHYPCKVCDAPVNGHYVETAFPQHKIIHLCEQHCNRESLEKVLVVGDQISSW